MDIDDVLLLYEQMKLIKRRKSYPESRYTLEEILELTQYLNQIGLRMS